MNQLASSPSQQGWPPHGLVSLWDMIEVRVAALADLMAAIRQERIFEVNRDHYGPTDHIGYLVPMLEYAKQCFSGTGGTAHNPAIDRLLVMIRSGQFRGNIRIEHLQEIESRIRDQMVATVVIAVHAATAKYYSNNQPYFGVDVADRFPKIVYELDEAGKCLALDRTTACVFHLTGR